MTSFLMMDIQTKSHPLRNSYMDDHHR